MRHWPKLIPVLVSLVATLGPGVAWVEHRYAKALEVQTRFVRLERSVEDVARELTRGQLENRRTILRGEQFRLQSQKNPTALERQRLNEVGNELHDVERQLEHFAPPQ